MSLQTLLELASAFDVALSVKFVDYPTFVRETKDVSTANMQVPSFSTSAFMVGEANSIGIELRGIGTSSEKKIGELSVSGMGGKVSRITTPAGNLTNMSVAGHG
jgi:hypothetical protein